MKSNNPGQSKKSSKRTDGVSNKGAIRCAVPAIIVLVTLIPFLPALRSSFVEWDDYETLVNNLHYRGLGWAQLSWMFTTFHMGHYQPLSWVTFGIDYLLWGMEPFGYHLTNVILHTVNSIFFYFISRRLLSLVLPVTGEAGWQPSMSAAFAALFFAIHPLRVESVAWATERRDVLSGFFYLSTVYCYVRAALTPQIDTQRRWLVAAVVAYALSLLSKATAITLPAILLLLDVFPLRRLTGGLLNWFKPPLRSVLWEKIPFVVLAFVFAVTALLAQQSAGALRSVQQYDFVYRIAQVFYGLTFYLWKTLVPLNLSPLYEITPDFTSSNPLIVATAAGIIIATLCLFLLRNRWAAGLACWVYYIVVLAPLLGIAQSGPQLVADRYSYLSCLSWALLAGGTLLLCQRRRDEKFTSLSSWVAAGLAIAVLGAFGVLSWKQTQIWRDTGTVWSYVLALDPRSSIAHYNLGRFLAKQGQQTKAIAHYREAIKIRPDDADTHNNLGLLLAIRGEVNESLREFQQAVEIDPNHARAYFNMGRVLAHQGEHDNAVRNYRQALQLLPMELEIHIGLGRVLAAQGNLDEAIHHLRQALSIRPDSGEAHAGLARVLAIQGKNDEAVRHYQEALRLLRSENQTLGR